MVYISIVAFCCSSYTEIFKIMNGIIPEFTILARMGLWSYPLKFRTYIADFRRGTFLLRKIHTVKMIENRLCGMKALLGGVRCFGFDSKPCP